MAYSAKCDTASATKWWITGTGTAENRLSEVMDDNASGVEEADNLGNYQPWSTFMTEILEDAIYQFHLPFEIGNSTTTTTLLTLNEHLYFDAECYPLTKANSTWTDGTKISSTLTNDGSFIVISDTDGSGSQRAQLGVTNWYGTHVYSKMSGSTNAGYKADQASFQGSGELINCFLGWRNYFTFYSTGYTSTQNTFGDIWNGMQATLAGQTLTDPIVLVTNASGYALRAGFSGGGTLIVVNPVWSQGSLFYTHSSQSHLVYVRELVGACTFRSDVTWHADTMFYQQYSCNIHVVDKDGVALQSVVVDCEDTNAGAVWTAGTVSTDASGDITEQLITYKTFDTDDWDSDPSGTSLSPHKFTISKAGYETLILDAITVDAPIVWHLELQASKQPPAPWQDGLM